MFSAVASSYGRLIVDARFFLPAVSVSLVIGGLYTFFAAAPAILMNELGLTAFQLGLSFATTVLIVFAAGFLAPRLAHRWGQRTVGMIGLFIALAGGDFDVRVRRHTDLHALHHRHRGVSLRDGIDQSAWHRDCAASIRTTGWPRICAAWFPANGLRGDRRVIVERTATSAVYVPRRRS